eukprot:865105_1
MVIVVALIATISANIEDDNLLDELEHLGEDKLENNNNVAPNHEIIVSLSMSALKNIWAIVMVILVFNSTLFACYYHKHSKKKESMIRNVEEQYP